MIKTAALYHLWYKHVALTIVLQYQVLNVHLLKSFALTCVSCASRIIAFSQFFLLNC